MERPKKKNDSRAAITEKWCTHPADEELYCSIESEYYSLFSLFITDINGGKKTQRKEYNGLMTAKTVSFYNNYRTAHGHYNTCVPS